MSSSAFSIAPIAWRATPPRDCTERVASTAFISSMSIGLMPSTDGIKVSIAPVSPGLPKLSLYSDQPTVPSSVTSLRNEKVRQPASHLKIWNVLTFIVSSSSLGARHSSGAIFFRSRQRRATGVAPPASFHLYIRRLGDAAPAFRLLH